MVLWLEGSVDAGRIQLWWQDLANCEGAVVGLSPGGPNGEIPHNYANVRFASMQDECQNLSPPTEEMKEPSTNNQGLSIFFT